MGTFPRCRMSNVAARASSKKSPAVYSVLPTESEQDGNRMSKERGGQKVKQYELQERCLCDGQRAIVFAHPNACVKCKKHTLRMIHD